MTHEEKYEIDKSNWPRGPWNNEPDKLNWTDEATGLPCMIVRNRLGALCGYVAVAGEHPFFGKHYDQCSPNGHYIDVHGGLTYANFCNDHICHVPEPGQPDRVWWFGFDCAHSHDLIPGLPYLFLMGRHGEEQYRDIAYVKAECASLAKQLAAVK